MIHGCTPRLLKWFGDQLILPVDSIVYPEEMDELLGAVESRDPKLGGWVTMSVLEAHGGEHTETVRGATELTFLIRGGYKIEQHEKAKFRFCFRKSNTRSPPEYMMHTGIIPKKPERPEIIGLETEGKLDSKFGGVATYRVAANGDHIANDGTILSTAESRAKEDVPQWRKFELGRLEILDNVVIPGPKALPKDIEQYGENVKLTKRHKVEKPTKIMPDDPNHTPLEKALNWAAETHHGPAHQGRWNRIAATLGADNGHAPMTLAAVAEMWRRFNQNPRWTMALDAVEESASIEEVQQAHAEERKLIEEMDYYHNAPPVQGNYSADEWRKRYGAYPDVALVPKWGKYIIDPQVREPLWKLDGDFPASQDWDYIDGGWVNLEGLSEEPEEKPYVVKMPQDLAKAIEDGDWETVVRIAQEKAK